MKKWLEAKLAVWLPGKFDDYMVAHGSKRYIPRYEHSLEIPYLDRYYVLRTPWLSFFPHHYYSSDEAGYHCHPWWSISIPLVVGFWEQHHDGTETWRSPFSITVRSAREVHRVRLDLDAEGEERECWTLFIKFKRIRDWGFLRQDLKWDMMPVHPDSAKLHGWWLPRHEGEEG